MDNKEFIDRLSAKLGLNPERTGDVIDSLCEVIANTVADEDCVVVPAFGSFEPKKKMERIVTHPFSGKKMLIPPKLTLAFRPSAILKNDIKASDHQHI